MIPEFTRHTVVTIHIIILHTVMVILHIAMVIIHTALFIHLTAHITRPMVHHRHEGVRWCNS